MTKKTDNTSGAKADTTNAMVNAVDEPKKKTEPAPSAGSKKTSKGNASAKGSKKSTGDKAPRGPSTGDYIIEALKRPEGATVEQMLELSKTEDRPGGWQPHTLRGFISGTVRRKHGYEVEVKRDGKVTRYRITNAPAKD